MGRINLVRVQQGFGVLSVALGSQALSLTASLLEDVAFEISGREASGEGDDDRGSSERIEPATFDLFHPFTATQRIALIFNSVPFIQLLFNVAVISYRKACNLKSLMNRAKATNKTSTEVTSLPPPLPVRRQPSGMDEIEEDSFSDDDADAEFHDSVSNNVGPDEDDEDEPLLGKWFEDTLFPPEEKTKDGASAKEHLDDEEKDVDEGEDASDNAIGTGPHVPDRGEPTGFISLASHIFIFMDKHLLMTLSGYVRNYVYTRLTEQQMTVLAAITRDLDLEASASSAMPSSSSTSKEDANKTEYHLGSLYTEFSSTLANFTHNLLAHNLLTPKLTNSLLHQLGVFPFNPEQEWPLHVYPRTLAVLTQVLLIRQQSPPESDHPVRAGGSGAVGGATGGGTAYVTIWERALSSLTRRVLALDSSSDHEDMNVEHAQLLLFLFHSLVLMQKKQVSRDSPL